MPHVELDARRGHLLTVVSSLCLYGWSVESVPADGRLPQNDLRLVLRTTSGDRRFRVLVYKVSRSSRNRDWERRIEITSTYQGRLTQAPGYRDIVLGFDAPADMFVGVDQLRLQHGGPTHNASSFIDRDALDWGDWRQILIRPRQTELRDDGVEYHAYFRPSCLADYLLNVSAIHEGRFNGPMQYVPERFRRTDRYRARSVNAAQLAPGRVTLSEPTIRTTLVPVEDELVEEFERTQVPPRRRRLSPEALRQIMQRNEDNGRLGERFVLDSERRRLARARRTDLANQVCWISQENVAEGYDIASFEADGDPRLIEVKSTIGDGMTFPMSAGEWRAAAREGNRYWIYRVTTVRDGPRIAARLQNPVQLEADEKLVRAANGYEVTIVP